MNKEKVEISNAAGIYKEIAELVGIEGAYRIYKNFSGLQVCFPKNFYDKNFLKQQIKQEYSDGTNIRALARKYGYTERWIRKLLSEDSKGGHNEHIE